MRKSQPEGGALGPGMRGMEDRGITGVYVTASPGRFFSFRSASNSASLHPTPVTRQPQGQCISIGIYKSAPPGHRGYYNKGQPRMNDAEGFKALLEEYGLDDTRLDAAARYCRLPHSVSWSFLLITDIPVLPVDDPGMIYSQALRSYTARQSHGAAAGLLQAMGVIAATTSGGTKKGMPFDSSGGTPSTQWKADHVSRWEGLPLTSVDSVCEGEDGGAALALDTGKEEEEEKREETVKSHRLKWLQWIKLAVPHIILICVLLSYVAAGSLILQRLENGTEVTQRYERLVRLDQTFRWIVNETWQLKENNVTNYQEWHDYVYGVLLQNISYMYEKRRLSTENMQLHTEWTFPTAVLYTLTVLTACGYSHIDPLTDTGRLFAVGFALVGIPLMFITAADIGKFLSDIFKMVCQLWRRCNQAFLWKFCRRRMKRREKALAANNNKSSAEGMEDLMDPEGAGEGSGEGGEQDDANPWFPITAYLVLMCMYCTVGALLFRSYERDWGFVYAFHFAFNTVVTVGMGNVVVTDIFYLCMIVAYVIIGLAVVTMCVDLASTHLQRYFHKIHYFGRARRRFLGMSEDIREMVALIAAMRKKKGGKVTWNDLKKYMETEAGPGWEGRLPSFIPRNVHLWKYIDDTSSAVSTYRHNSVNSCSSTASGAKDKDRRKAHHHRRDRSSYHHHHRRSGRARAPSDADPDHKHELTPPSPRLP